MNKIKIASGIFACLFFLLFAITAYLNFVIDVPQGQIAVMTKKTGKTLPEGQLIATESGFKGIQIEPLSEGRYFRDSFNWSWSIYPMVEIPHNKLGVRTRLYGENLPSSEFIVSNEKQKGILPEVLRPGRYALNALVFDGKAINEVQIPPLSGKAKRNDFVEIIELFDPVIIPAGYRGVVTNLSGPIPENPNTLLVEEGYRGVQKNTLDAGTYFVNPYMVEINLVDCRSQRFNLSENEEIGFPSKDGFWVSLDGIVEFRVMPEKVAEIFVAYNEHSEGEANQNRFNISDEIVKKIITPNARSFCRLRGSNNVGRDFIGGETRTAFQKDFSDAMKKACEPSGIEIVQALITKIHPPQAIAEPVRNREISRQKLLQFKEQKLQQLAEAKLAIEKATIEQRQELVQADTEVNGLVTTAMQKQKVAVTKAEEILEVAKRDLAASQDLAEASLIKFKGEATTINLQNLSEAAGWKKTIDAFQGNGNEFAQYVLYKKIAPSFQKMMINTSDSSLMKIFDQFKDDQSSKSKPAAPAKAE